MKGKKQKGHIPMTDPQGLLAEHHQNYFHSVSWVELSGGLIGMIFSPPTPHKTNRYGRRQYFCRSQDEGKTWSKPVLINLDISANAYQDVLLRTSPGRIIYPVYASLGQGMYRHEEAPVVGGYVNGNFVSTEAPTP